MAENVKFVSTKATEGEDLVPNTPVDQVTQLAVEDGVIFSTPSELNAVVENINEVNETPNLPKEEFKTTVVEPSEFDQILDDATAAGLGAGGENGGNSFVRLLRIVEEVTPLSYEFPTNATGDLLPIDGGTALDAPDPYLGAMSLTATPETIEDQGFILYTVTLDNPARTDMTVTLSNAVTILIPTGATVGYGTLEVNEDDPYIDQYTQETAINAVTGGGFDVLTVSTEPQPTVINDDQDVTTVMVTAEDTNENQQVGMFTVSLSNPGETDVTVTTNYGTVVITAGETEGYINVPVFDPDVYVDPSSISLQVLDVQGGNFEAVDYSEARTSINITDTIDVTTVTIAGNDITENDPGAWFTVSLSNPGETDVVVQTDLGSAFIPRGETTGQLFVSTTDPDVYVDPSELSIKVTNVLGGNFEAVDYSEARTSINITDTIDDTHATLFGDLVVGEGVSAGYTISLSNVPETPLTFDVSYSYRGASPSDITIVTQQVTVPAGAYGTTFVVPTVNDLEVEPSEFFSVSISNPRGGNFENLIIDNDSVETEITDNDVLPVYPTVTVDLEVDPGATWLSGTQTDADSIVVTVTGTDGYNKQFTATINNGSWSADVTGEQFNEEVTYTAVATAVNSDGSDTATDIDRYDFEEPPEEYAPTLQVWSDNVDNGIYDRGQDNQVETMTTSNWSDTNQSGTDKVFIGDLLKEGQPISQAQLDSNPPSVTMMNYKSDITFTFLNEGAGYKNAVGWYDVNNPSIGYVVWENASKQGSGGSLNNSDPPVTFDDVAAGTQIGFFLIPDSYNIEGAIPDTIYFDGGKAYKDAAHTQLIDSNDNGMAGENDPVWFSNSPNIDGLQHVVTGISATDDPNVLYVGFEDLGNGGDKDYNDVIFKVDLGEGNGIIYDPVVFDLGVTIADQDSTMLSKAVLDFGLQDGDQIDYTNVAGLHVERVSDTFTITGDASILDYNDLLDSFRLTITNEEGVNTGDRHAVVQVFDESNHASALETAIFSLAFETPKVDYQNPDTL